jgi:hypothetical protein
MNEIRRHTASPALSAMHVYTVFFYQCAPCPAKPGRKAASRQILLLGNIYGTW